MCECECECASLSLVLQVRGTWKPKQAKTTLCFSDSNGRQEQRATQLNARSNVNAMQRWTWTWTWTSGGALFPHHQLGRDADGQARKASLELGYGQVGSWVLDRRAGSTSISRYVDRETAAAEAAATTLPDILRGLSSGKDSQGDHTIAFTAYSPTRNFNAPIKQVFRLYRLAALERCIVYKGDEKDGSIIADVSFNPVEHPKWKTVGK
ncbi:hypothetical protein LZ32DRAFT_614926 [Colletotrichum eremochloae]|nr:hypothetical protein LZ32DRAFT_614926 [Colletotrichum eremochloae]